MGVCSDDVPLFDPRGAACWWWWWWWWWQGLAGHVKFVLYQDSSGMWRVQAVTTEGTAFTNRLGLLEAWRGLRDDKLEAAAGIAGCKFVHASGFIGGNASYEGALEMAVRTMAAAPADVQ